MLRSAILATALLIATPTMGAPFVWRLPIAPESGETTIRLPAGSEILSVGRGTRIWTPTGDVVILVFYRTDTGISDEESITLRLIQNGEPGVAGERFVGTVNTSSEPDARRFFHVFETRLLGPIAPHPPGEHDRAADQSQ